MNESYLQIEQRLSLASVNADDIVVVWSRSLGALAGIKASDFQIGTSSNFEWVFDRDYDFDEVVTFNGLWWQSLIVGIGTNTGNVPAEGLNWTQINKISGLIIPLWTPGLVTDHLTLFREGNLIYGLKDTVTLPFDSQTTPSADPTNWEPIVSKLQDAYNVSNTNPQILTNATKGAFKIRRGSALDTDNIYEGQNGAGTITFSVNGEGDIVANSIQANAGTDTISWDSSDNVTIPNGTLSVSPDTDAITELGRLRIDSRQTDTAVISHVGNLSTPNFNLKMTRVGDLSFNVPTGRSIVVSVSNSAKWLWDLNGDLSSLSGSDLTIDGTIFADDRVAFGLTIGDVASPLEGQQWYNDTLGKFRVNQNGSVIDMIGGGASAGANNEIQSSDGAGGFVASKLFFDEATGDMSLGDSGLGGAGRDITAVGSATDIGITLRPKGANFVVVAGTLRTTGDLLTLGDFNLSGSGGIDFTIDNTNGSYSHVFETANTTTIGNYNIVTLRSTGTVAAGFGGQRAISIQLAGGGTSGSLFREEFSWETIDTDGLWELQIFGRSGIAMAGDSSAIRLGFFETTPIAKPTVTGSRGGNAALASFLTEMANLGLIIDSST